MQDGILMKHDWLPGGGIRPANENWREENSTYWKFMGLPIERRLTVYDRILEFFVYLETQDIIVEDFYDGSIMYDFQTHDVYLCDLDHIHYGEYELKKERRYGSSRFMAPEEFTKGATIDKRTSVYNMSATAFVLLNNNKRGPGQWPHARKLFDVFHKAISREKESRYQTVEELYSSWNQVSNGVQ